MKQCLELIKTTKWINPISALIFPAAEFDFVFFVRFRWLCQFIGVQLAKSGSAVWGEGGGKYRQLKDKPFIFWSIPSFFFTVQKYLRIIFKITLRSLKLATQGKTLHTFFLTSSPSIFHFRPLSNSFTFLEKPKIYFCVHFHWSFYA